MLDVMRVPWVDCGLRGVSCELACAPSANALVASAALPASSVRRVALWVELRVVLEVELWLSLMSAPWVEEDDERIVGLASEAR
ncbi:hypothetical protein D3C71_1711790 [compost metagenome]